MSKESMKLALEAYMAAGFGNSTDFALQRKAHKLAVEALADRPAQQKPVARYIGEGSEGSLVQLYDDVKKGTDFYTSPQPAQRKPLTDDQITQVANETYGPTSEWEVEQIRLDFARAIEAAHGIKGDA